MPAKQVFVSIGEPTPKFQSVPDNPTLICAQQLLLTQDAPDESTRSGNAILPFGFALC
jgi:hypothetical protein